MSTAPQTKLTPAEYLAIERQAEFKSEYYRGEMFAMAGASEGHCLVKDNLARRTSFTTQKAAHAASSPATCA